jgi:antitoxin MazE
MQTTLIKIGNSQGVRLPKALIEAARLGPKIELELIDGGLMMRSSQKHPHDGWDAAFKADPPALSDEDKAWLEADLSPEADKDWTW